MRKGVRSSGGAGAKDKKWLLSAVVAAPEGLELHHEADGGREGPNTKVGEPPSLVASCYVDGGKGRDPQWRWGLLKALLHGRGVLACT